MTIARILVASAVLGLATLAHAQAALPAGASDPHAIGWMQGFPPPANKTIALTDPDYFAFPKLRWTMCHFRESSSMLRVDATTFSAKACPEALMNQEKRLLALLARIDRWHIDADGTLTLASADGAHITAQRQWPRTDESL